MNEIKAWLISGRDYTAGFQLYQKFGSSDVLKRILAKETAFNSNKLLQELVKLSHGVEEQIRDVKVFKESGIYIEKDFDELPDHIKELIDQARNIYKEIGARHAELRTHIKIALKKPTPAELKKYCDENKTGDQANIILDLDEQREAILFKIDFFKREKRLPDDPLVLPQTILEMSAGEIRAELLKLRPQISKNKNKPARAEDVTSWTAKRDILERRLDELI